MHDNMQTKLKAYGQTKAEIDNAGDSALIGALERAEVKAGHQGRSYAARR